jgi:hypothetical protein
MADLYPEDVAETERDQQTREARDQSQQIVFLPHADHALEELTAIEDSYPIEKHDQASQTDRSRDLSLWSKRSDCKADEENRTDTERKSADTDLTYEITQSNRKECRQYRLASDDIACKVQHV